jgi:hypothetical protein
MTTKNTRVDDDDLDDFLIGLHRSLDPLLNDGTFAGARTLGELSDAIWRQLPDKARSGGKCPTSMCYYRLKAYFRAKHPGQVITPHTRLSDIRAFSYHDAEQELEHNGWNMPGRKVVAATWLMALATAIAFYASLSPYIGIDGSVIVAGIVFLFGLAGFHSILTGGLPKTETVGDLAREMRTSNLGLLIRNGASLSRAEVWRLFTENAWDHDVPTTRSMSWLA